MTSQGLEDAFRVLYPDAATDHGYSVNQTSLSSQFDESPSNDRIDYCFVPNGDAGIKVVSCAVNMKDFKYADAVDHTQREISDHFPLARVEQR